MNTNVKIKDLNGKAYFPQKGTLGAAGFDLSGCLDTYIMAGAIGKVMTGMAIAIPEGYVGLLIERSSLHKRGLSLSNTVGVIDSDYRGEIIIALTNTTKETILIKEGERVAQLIIVPVLGVNLIPVGELNETSRGSGGFGSTGS